MQPIRVLLLTAAILAGTAPAPRGWAQALTPGYAVSVSPGSNSWVTATLPGSIPYDYTISAWVYLRSGSVGFDPGTAVLSSAACGDSAEFLMRGGAATPQTLELGRCNVFFGTQSTGTVPLSNWVNVAVSVSSAKQVSYFIDGAPAGVWAASGDVTLAANLVLGANTGNRQFDGLLDEFQIWKPARTQAQIQTNLYRSLAGNEHGLLLYYRFDEGAGTTTTNSAGGAPANSGRLTNGPVWVVSTLPFPPGAITSNALTFGSNSVTFLGGVIPNYLPTGASFEWGATTNPYPYTNLIAQALGSGGTNIPVSATVTGLAPATVYHFRLAATNAAGARFGTDATVRTPAMRLVTTLADDGPGSLRAAISNSLSGDYVLFATNGVITNLSELAITNALNIIGPGADQVALSGGNSNRIFNLASNANLTLYGLTLRDGRSADGINQGGFSVNGGSGAPGGAVYSAGTLLLDSCILVTNHAGAGGVSGEGATSGSGGDGGAIYSTGTLVLTNCWLQGNHSGNGGSRTATIGNGGSGGGGGAIFSTGSLAIWNCVFTANSAGTGTAGNLDYGGSGGSGGALYCSGPLAMTLCTLSSNSAGNAGSSPFYGSLGGDGGAIYCAGPLAVTNCTVSANHAGAGYGSYYGGFGGNGGGVCADAGAILIGCTLSSNAAGNGNANYYGGAGGGGGGLCAAAGATLVACTLAFNSAGAGANTYFYGGTSGRGGGLFFPPGTNTNTLVNILLAGNTGTGTGTGPDVAGTIQSLGHNLISRADPAVTLPYQSTDRIGSTAAPLNAYLAPLADNGGSTPTLALLGASPAIDAGDDTLTAPPYSLAFDQRGLPRRLHGHVDIGAYEANFADFAAPSVTTLAPGVATNNAVTESAQAPFNAVVNANGLPTGLWFQYGLSTAYGSASAVIGAGFDTNPITTNLLVTGLLPGLTYHLRAAATNALGTNYGGDQVLATTPFLLAGDLNGDGIVSASEAGAVLANYFGTGGATILTNPASLGGGYFQFGITNLPAWGLNVQASSDLLTWSNLPTAAFPTYEFLDAAATNAPQRFYRLR